MTYKKTNPKYVMLFIAIACCNIQLIQAGWIDRLPNFGKKAFAAALVVAGVTYGLYCYYKTRTITTDPSKSSTPKADAERKYAVDISYQTESDQKR